MKKPRNLYPLSEKAPEKAVSASGMPLGDLTLDAIVSQRVNAADIRISADVLRLQAGIARDAGRDRLALNFERAADLVAVPQDLILKTYEMLRAGPDYRAAAVDGNAPKCCAANMARTLSRR
jgi:propanediol dehydratase small subunit